MDQTKQETVAGGYGPAFPVTDMPESPLKGLTAKGLFLMMGPAVIALGGAIGGGEWLVGPAMFVKYGLVLLWVTTVSTTLQTFLNLEMTRYTLVTGEPITLGFMRLAPGKAFWGVLFTIAGFVERAMPGWAIATGTAIAAMQLARIPGAADKSTVVFWGYIVFIACLTNWYRDKGYGMAAKIGYISTAIGGKSMHVSSSGSLARSTPENVEHFKGWWKLLNIDQWSVFWVGGMVGMLLPAILYVSQLPPGESLASWGIAVSSASGLVQRFGILGLYMVAFIGFWVLFSTAISNVDLVPRQATDMLWFASGRVRQWSKNDIRKVYYALLIGVIVWGSLYMNITLPLIIFAISANVANFTMALSAILTVIVNRKFLPKEYRPAVWREVVMIVCTVFFGFFFTLFILTQFLGVKLS